MKGFITAVGKCVSWISLLLVVLICLDVLFRYFFNSTQVWLIELEWYLFGVLFLLSGAWCWQQNKHVRVDVFYGKFKPASKRRLDFIGTLFVGIPWICVVLYASFKYAAYSYGLNEGSPDPGGLPARYLIKFGIFIGFSLMLLAAVSSLFQSTITKHED